VRQKAENLKDTASFESQEDSMRKQANPVIDEKSASLWPYMSRFDLTKPGTRDRSMKYNHFGETFHSWCRTLVGLST